jgi:hypothetical protein
MANVASATGKQKAAVPAETTATSEQERTLALAFLSGLATEVSKGTVNLPSFPDVVMRIRKALAEPNVRTSEIVKIVGTEPRLSARLLQVANSAAFNPTGKHLTDLRAAVTRLGHRPVQGAVMAFAVKQVRLAPALRSISPHLNILWEQSISVAAICQVLAKRTKVAPEEAFLTGLLHGIGRLYIMVRAAGMRPSAKRCWRIGASTSTCAKRLRTRPTSNMSARTSRISPMCWWPASYWLVCCADPDHDPSPWKASTPSPACT